MQLGKGNKHCDVVLIVPCGWSPPPPPVSVSVLFLRTSLCLTAYLKGCWLDIPAHTVIYCVKEMWAIHKQGLMGKRTVQLSSYHFTALFILYTIKGSREGSLEQFYRRTLYGSLKNRFWFTWDQFQTFVSRRMWYKKTHHVQFHIRPYEHWL